MSEPEWRERWDAERLFITADGEADKRWGNETIRWHPEERWLELKLPAPLGFLANRPHGRYRLDCPVAFSYRGSEVAAQASGGAVRYDISYQPERKRWYLDASWKLPARPVPELGQVLSRGVLGVDLNAGHLAAWGLDADGNRRSRPHTVELALEGLAASTRDGRLRAAVSALIGLARLAPAVRDLEPPDLNPATLQRAWAGVFQRRLGAAFRGRDQRGRDRRGHLVVGSEDARCAVERLGTLLSRSCSVNKHTTSATATRAGTCSGAAGMARSIGRVGRRGPGAEDPGGQVST